MQGFLFSRPLPAPEIERLFLSGHEARKAPGRIVAAVIALSAVILGARLEALRTRNDMR